MQLAKRLGDDTKLRRLIQEFSWTEFIQQTKIGVDRLGVRNPNARGLQSGAAAELAQEVSRSDPNGYNPYCPVVPWEVFTRDLSVAAGGGAYLVEQSVQSVAQALRPWSTVVGGGVQVVGNLVGGPIIPNESTPLVTYWLTNEGTTTTESTPTLGAIPLTPRMVGTTFDVSRLLRLQGTGLDVYCNTAPLRAIAATIDKAVIQGGGTSDPQGLITTPNVGAATGGTFALSHVLAAREAVANSGADDLAASWIGHGTTRKLLSAREKVATSGRMIWADDLIDARPARVTTNCPTGVLVHGDFSQITLAVWGAGPVVEVTETASSSNFQAGIVSMRVLVACDSAVRHPSAFHVTSSIT